MTKTFVCFGASLLTLLGLSFASRALAQYKLTDLGTLNGGTQSLAEGFNDLGQAVGVATDSQGIEHAFLYTGGVIQDLGTYGYGNGFAVGINNAGAIAAGGFTVNANLAERGFLVVKGIAKEIGTLGGNTTQVKAINASGVVVGTSDTQTSTLNHAFLYDGIMHDLGVLGGISSEATGINALGTVIGDSTTSTPGVTHFFRYSNGIMKDMGSFSALAINDSDTIAGSLGGHAATYLNGVTTDLGTLGGTTSAVYGINAANQMVGSSDIGGGVQHTFFYSGGQMRDLSTMLDPVSGAGWDINSNSPTAIDAAGQILGTGIFGGNDHAYILTAVGPEPCTLWIFLSGGAIMVRCRGRARKMLD